MKQPEPESIENKRLEKKIIDINRILRDKIKQQNKLEEASDDYFTIIITGGLNLIIPALKDINNIFISINDRNIDLKYIQEEFKNKIDLIDEDYLDKSIENEFKDTIEKGKEQDIEDIKDIKNPIQTLQKNIKQDINKPLQNMMILSAVLTHYKIFKEQRINNKNDNLKKIDDNFKKIGNNLSKFGINQKAQQLAISNKLIKLIELKEEKEKIDKQEPDHEQEDKKKNKLELKHKPQVQKRRR